MSSESTSSPKFKNFNFLLPHLPKFNCELRDLLLEVDRLIEGKRLNWQQERGQLETKLARTTAENDHLHRQLAVTKNTNNSSASSPSSNRNNEVGPTSPTSTTSKRQSLISDKQLAQLQEQVRLIGQQYAAIKNSYDNRSILRQSPSPQITSPPIDLWLQVEELKAHNSRLADQLNEAKTNESKQIQALACQLDQEKLASHQSRRHLQTRVDKLEQELGECRQRYHDLQLTHEASTVNANTLTAKQAQDYRQLEIQLGQARRDLRSSQHRAKDLNDSNQQLTTLLGRFNQDLNRTVALIDSTIAPPNDSNPLRDTNQLLVKSTRLFELVRDRKDHINRLEQTCRTASHTITRLVDAKSSHASQLATCRQELREALSSFQCLQSIMVDLKQTLTSRLVGTRERVQHLTDLVSTLSEQLPIALQRSIDRRRKSRQSHACSQTNLHSSDSNDHFISQTEFASHELQWMTKMDQLERKVESMVLSSRGNESSDSMTVVKPTTKDTYAIDDQSNHVEHPTPVFIETVAISNLQHQNKSSSISYDPDNSFAPLVNCDRVPAPSSPIVTTTASCLYSTLSLGSLSHADFDQHHVNAGSFSSPSEYASFSFSQYPTGPSTNLHTSHQSNHGIVATRSPTTTTSILRSSPLRLPPIPVKKGGERSVVSFVDELPSPKSVRRDYQSRVKSNIGDHHQQTSSVINTGPPPPPPPNIVNPHPTSSVEQQSMAATNMSLISNHSDDNDLLTTGITNLTQRFLADERKHSALLEQRIDARLGSLRRKLLDGKPSNDDQVGADVGRC